jgi:hypothetical protein
LSQFCCSPKSSPSCSCYLVKRSSGTSHDYVYIGLVSGFTDSVYTHIHVTLCYKVLSDKLCFTLLYNVLLQSFVTFCVLEMKKNISK